MADTYTIGEVRRLYYVAEATYATTVTSSLVYAGLPVSIKPKSNFKIEPEYVQGSRSFSTAGRDGMVEMGFSYQGKAQAVSGGYNWKNFFAVYGFGSLTGIEDGSSSYGRIGSFSAIIGITQGINTYYNLYNGCVIDSLKISCDEPGKAILFDAEILAQYVDYGTSKTFTRLQSVTVGADPTTITTDILRWAGNIQVNIAAGGLTTIYPSKFALTVKNNITREPGNRTGADAVIYPVAIDMTEGAREIMVELTLPRKSQTFQNAKIANSAITALTIPIGVNTITLTGGVFAADDLAELKLDSPLDETVKMIFNGLTIA